MELSLVPNLLQRPSGSGRTINIITSLHNDTRYVSYLVYVTSLKELTIAHEAGIDEVVVLDARVCVVELVVIRYGECFGVAV